MNRLVFVVVLTALPFFAKEEKKIEKPLDKKYSTVSNRKRAKVVII